MGSTATRGATSASTEEGLEWGGTPAEPEERSLLMTGIQYSRNTTVRNPAYFRVPMPGVRLDRRPGTKPGERVLDQRPEQGDEPERHDRANQSVGDEDAEATLRRQQRLPECLLRLVAKYDRQHQRRQGIIALLQGVADDAEHQHHHHVEGRVVHGVGADCA